MLRYQAKRSISLVVLLPCCYFGRKVLLSLEMPKISMTGLIRHNGNLKDADLLSRFVSAADPTLANGTKVCNTADGEKMQVANNFDRRRTKVKLIDTRPNMA